MSSNAGPSSNESRQDGLLVSGSRFDGEPYQVVLERTRIAHGASGQIFRGRLVGGPPRVTVVVTVGPLEVDVKWIPGLLMGKLAGGLQALVMTDRTLVVAVKVIPGLLDPVLDALLARELRAAQMVSERHPSILPFLGTADVGGRTGIVSMFMDNGNLKQYIKSHYRCDKKKLILQVADAVSFLHGTMGLVHGDIKCENVLISYEGDALLADFGLSTFAEKSQTATATMTAIRQMNTLQFAAPELLLGDGTTIPSKTRESDVYAFGMLVLEALSESLPWPNHSNFSVMQKVCSGQHPARPTLDGGPFVSISHSWWQTCQSCWRFNPHERFRITDVLSTLKATEPVRVRVLPINEDVRTAVYMPDGEMIVAASRSAIVRSNTTSGQIQRLRQPPSFFYACPSPAISPDGRYTVCIVENSVWVMAAASGLVSSLEHDTPLECVAYSRDGTRIASVSGPSGTTIRSWDTATGTSIGQILEAHTGAITSVSFSPDGICLASASCDGTIRLWDSTTFTPMATLELRNIPSFYLMEFSPGGMHIAAAWRDSGMVIILDVCARHAVHFFETQSHCVNDLSFSPSGRYVAAALGGGCIEIWDVQDGHRVGAPLNVSVQSVAVKSVAFSPDGKSLVSTAEDGKVRVLDLFD